MIERHERSVALICMEELDEPFARAIHREMAHPERAGVFSSREHDASRMTALLRSLGVLVTSRYHASVLSLPEGVPQVAVGHDLRLRTLYEELGLDDAFFAVDDPGMFDGITNAVERLLRDPATVRDRLLVGYEAHAAAARRNKELLQAFAVAHGWGVPAWAT
jgi:polysaccharide pyruvyl transferase WcaK-like protein